jgi:membrane associated rhomboid family serine protease
MGEMMETDPNAPPLNPLPWIVWVLLLPLIAMEVVLGLGSTGAVGGPMAIGWRLDAVQRFAFAPDLLRQGWETGVWQGEAFWRMLSYPFVHASFSHAIMATVIILALGKWVGEVFRPWAVLVVVAGGSVAGAVAYTMIPGTHAALIGAYPPAYGLIGAFTFMLWVKLAATGGPQARAFLMIGVLVGWQLVFRGGAMIFAPDQALGWDWVADLAGFAAGFALSFLVCPGGWDRVMARLRQR